MWRNRDGIFLLKWQSLERRKKDFPVNHERHVIYGGAGVVKINFPMSGEATNGEIYFSPRMGKFIFTMTAKP